MQSMGVFKRVIAVEPTPDLAATCQRRGLEVIPKPIEDVELEQLEVDAVVSFEVIEHLFSPRDLLNNCFRVLSPNGLLVITCPNGEGFEIQAMGEASSTVEIGHLNYFNPRSLSELAKSCGFEVLESFTPGKLDAELVRKGVLRGDITLAGQPFLNRVLIEEWDSLGQKFQQFLSENGLSTHMWLVARKPKA
jgi:SAM-dependent methyltransferase